MLKQSTLLRTEGPLRNKISRYRFRALLAVITLAAGGAVIGPPVMAALSNGAELLGPATYSHVTRASALAAYGLLWLSMLAGLSVTTRLARHGGGPSAGYALHRYASLLGLGLALLHALSLFGDPYAGYTLTGLAVPFASEGYRPHWLGLGQVALYLFGAISLSFFVRDRLGVRTWRLVHSLSFALFLLALIHGLQSGSDSSTPWATALYWVSGASVLLGSLYRMLGKRRGRARETVAASGRIIAGGRAQARPLPATVTVSK
jgi:predicted ferric reductase